MNNQANTYGSAPNPKQHYHAGRAISIAGPYKRTKPFDQLID
jgi:hypothetical protein